jgi:hypothetical protein
MSVQEKISRLEAYIRDNPAFSSVPFMSVAGKPITPSEALSLLRAGQHVSEITAGLEKIGVDPPDQTWELAEEFYRRLAAVSPDYPKIYALSSYIPAMSPKEALEHIRAKDSIGEQLVKLYSGMLDFMALQTRK